MRSTVPAVVLLLAVSVARSDADVALLLAEPYGRAGGFNPTGHVGVYLSRVCAETPTRVRRCRDGETGVVISRYNKVAGLDWVAIPLIPYLYGVDRAADVPTVVTPEYVEAIRDAYRRAHLYDLLPDAAGGGTALGKWRQLVGAGYDRRIIAFSISTSLEQDDRLIAVLNERDNRSRFHLLFRNCADFAGDVINLYYAGAISRSFLADMGLTTPKQIVKSLVQFGARRPDLQLTVYLIPQIPGNRPESGPVRGVLELLLKTKKYAVPLMVVQPWVPVGLGAGYLVRGRFDPQRHVTLTLEPEDIEQRALLATGEARAVH